MEGYRFVRLSEDNLFNLVYLYKDCFDLKVDLDFLKKKYNTISFGAGYIGFLAFEKETNEPAGYYGVFPVQGCIKGKKVLLAQSGDTMTHSKHQGKGLFIQLARMTYDLAKSEGIDFIFGFPNQNSYPGFKKKLDWQFENDVNNYTIKTGALPFDKFFKKFPLLGNVYNKFVAKIMQSLRGSSDIRNSLEKLDPERGYILHDEKFYAYKSYYTAYKVKINSVGCLIKVDGRMWIGDVESCTEAQFIMVIAGLVQLAKKVGCSSIIFSVTHGTFYDKILKKKFEIKSKNPIGYLDLRNTNTASEFAYQAVDFDTY